MPTYPCPNHDVGSVNSLTPGKFEWNFRHVIFKQILLIDGWGISCEIALIWMSLDFTDDQSTLVQVMAWCRQATSHYLSQCWPRSDRHCCITFGYAVYPMKMHTRLLCFVLLIVYLNGFMRCICQYYPEFLCNLTTPVPVKPNDMVKPPGTKLQQRKP